MPKIDLIVMLPHNRDYTGVMRVVVDGREVRRFPVLGRGSRGAGETSMLENGNTPTGTYAASYDSMAGRSTYSYGDQGALRLSPESGDAVAAHTIMHRAGLLIHGGAPGAHGGLRPTHGCLRLSNADMGDLHKIIAEAGANSPITAKVTEWGYSSSGDPLSRRFDVSPARRMAR